jgi:hypothetical protein
MDVIVRKGIYGGIPYLCIIKEQNQGKWDSPIVARSFFYNFNFRSTKPAVIFSPDFFGLMSSFLYIDSGITHVDALIGMDADTVFAPDCIYELIHQGHRRRLRVCRRHRHPLFAVVSLDLVSVLGIHDLEVPAPPAPVHRHT